MQKKIVLLLFCFNNDMKNMGQHCQKRLYQKLPQQPLTRAGEEQMLQRLVIHLIMNCR